jgi:hypothetical protein
MIEIESSGCFSETYLLELILEFYKLDGILQPGKANDVAHGP